jgi:hypothetical protein
MNVQQLRVVRPAGGTTRRKEHTEARRRPTAAQRRWLERGLTQSGGKLPLFDEFGQAINAQTIQSCIRQGWVEPWIQNPVKPDWLVCKLTVVGRMVCTPLDRA